MDMLKKWSSKWKCYIDVTSISEIDEEDHLIIMIAENAEKSTSSSHEQVHIVNLCVEYLC